MSRAPSRPRILPALRRGEQGRVGFFVALGALITLAQTVGLAGAEALFLARLGAARLPATFVVAAAATVFATLAYAFRVGRARNDRVFVELLSVSALAVGGAALAVTAGSVAALPALLCLFFAAQAVLVNHFWTLAGDLFDTLAAKRVAPLLGVGMSLGGAVGGGLAVALGRESTPALLWVWALALAVAAVLVRSARRPLRRWGALEFEEEDETSVESLRAATRFLRRSPLGRWLVASALAMVLALFVAQYLYSDVLAREFPDETELAAFLGLFLAVTNVFEVVIALGLVPWLIQRAGVARANLMHPVLTVASFLLLAASFRLPAALAARMNREMLENALAGPVRQLVYNALPLRFRARSRAFLEGVVVYAGMFVAGAILLVTGDLPPSGLALAGGGLALAYLLANLRVRAEYRRALVEELRARRLDLGELGGELGRRELSELARIWGHLLREVTTRPSPALLDLAPLLAARGFLEPLRGALGHSHPAVRRASLEALAATEAGGDPALWEPALRDRDPTVRLAALESFPESLRGALESLLRERLDDADPQVRAAAASRLGTEGRDVLAALVVSSDPREVTAALERLPEELGAEAARRLGDAHPEVRAAALECLARLREPPAVPLTRLVGELGHDSPRVRRAAVACLARRPEAVADADLASALGDPAREVRRAAVTALAARGEAGLAAARGQLDADSEPTVRSALRVLGMLGTRQVREQLRAEQRRRVDAAWDAQICLHALPLEEEGPVALLRLAQGDRLGREIRLAFTILALLEDPAVVRSVERTLRFATARGRADALEVLADLGDAPASQRLAVLLERSSLEERLRSLPSLPGGLPHGMDEVIERSRKVSSRWIRMAVDAAAGTGGNAMERLLFLRRVGLFSGLTLEQLEAIEGMTRELEFVPGEVIVAEGTPGKELFLIEEGQVTVYKEHGTPQGVKLNTLGPGGYFGEMAVLDSAVRSATVVATTPTRLLSLDGERLRELVHEMPDIAFEIFRVLASRIRSVEARLSAREGPQGTS